MKQQEIKEGSRYSNEIGVNNCQEEAERGFLCTDFMTWNLSHCKLWAVENPYLQLQLNKSLKKKNKRGSERVHEDFNVPTVAANNKLWGKKTSTQQMINGTQSLSEQNIKVRHA